MATRPTIELQSGVDNDIYALLNAQVGYPSVTIGAQLRIQNKGNSNVYIHEGTESIEVDGGITLPCDWQLTTSDGATGVIATCIAANGRLSVEVI